MILSTIEFGTPLYDASVALRNDLLRNPLNLEFTAEDLSLEYTSYHVAIFSNHYELLGILVLKPLQGGILKMRQVAVRQDIQSKGLGTALVKFSEKLAIDEQFTKIELSARETAVEFYKKLNYQVVGDRYVEVGIPHFKMAKTIKG